jgi:acyl-CoA synthetase (AMP-forming)/AMP-acid ligase II/peptidoglycan/LPS O-acetylase OafA/YrhL
MKILALHGSGSSSEVTRIQLDNIGLLQSEYDVIYANGPISTQQPGPGLTEIEGLVTGPWYSWLPHNLDESQLEGYKVLSAICEAVQTVLSIIDKAGPFDGIFGFSQGGVIASLVSGLHQDPVLQNALKDAAGNSLSEGVYNEAFFRTAIIACAASSIPISQLRLRAGLGCVPVSSFRSVHLIGRKDDFKPLSEALARSLNPATTEIIYLDDGHEINRRHRGDTQISNFVHRCLSNAQTDTEAHSTDYSELEWSQSSKLSSRSVAKNIQIVAVKLKIEQLPKTIIEVLANQPANAPLLRLAREHNENISTTYGQMLSFCQPGGKGDLRQLGVQANDIVAYLAPPGGSAVAAAAFLSIASQACAVPFSSNMSKVDALTALEQYRVTHMILFDGVIAKGVEAAFESFANIRSNRLHRAIHSDTDSPGLFTFLNAIDKFQDQPPLANQPAANSLLLRTSGTTSIPKVVPLRQQDLILNGIILADGMDINAYDITYSVMPLDHIGGISASILCSVAVGASITCDGLYSPQGMIDALMLSNPQPTWYSAVPTIHHATARYLQDQSEQYLSQNGEFHGHNLRMIRSGAAALKESDRSLLTSIFGCDVVSTYSMTELMPICQPPLKETGWHQKPAAVGVPVAASLAIVDPITLRPLPFGHRGEIVLSGPTVFSSYERNPNANNYSRFLMKLPQDRGFHTWFMTGDLGEIDLDGVLTIHGRLKELIKRGGEQISPAEIEGILAQHPSVKVAICFSILSNTYGEEVGCALVLEPSSDEEITQKNVMSKMREFLIQKELSSYKYPSVWKIVVGDDLPVTESKKYIRSGLADVLGLTVGNIERRASMIIDKRKIETQPPTKRERRSAVDLDNSHNSGSTSVWGVTVGNIERRVSMLIDINKIETQPSTKQERTSPVDLDNSHNSGSTTIMARNDKPQVDWAALAGLRFLLVCYVMFMHIGSNESWDAFSNLRQFPWHVHTFFALVGFSLTVIIPSVINKKLFISARISGLYPLYGLAVILALGNLLVSCNPSTFSSVFSWISLPSSDGQMFCQGTPLMQGSWLANVLLTVGIHLTGLQATPLWGASWFLGFYLWFISMYFQCLIIFPFVYNALYKYRDRKKRLLLLTILVLVINVLIVLSFWYGYTIDVTGYGFFDRITGERITPSPLQIELAGEENFAILSFYLFAPFWMVYFIAGMCAAFLYGAIRPSEQLRTQVWGYVADTITVIMVIISVAHIAQGYYPFDLSVTEVTLDPFFMRPEAANSYADPSTVNRAWDNIYGRLFAPITLLWIFALSTGEGLTAKALRFSPLSQTLSLTTYSCFLFHQMVGQWYYAATRHGEWWGWWSHQKDFYWFSPQPIPVEWYEYFYIVGLVVLFSKIVQPLELAIRGAFGFFINLFKKIKGGSIILDTEKTTISEILLIIESLTGMEVKPEWSLEECGLASLGVVQFTNTLEHAFSTPENQIKLSMTDIMSTHNIYEIASIVDNNIDSAKAELSR